jgi:hypothetical protein
MVSVSLHSPHIVPALGDAVRRAETSLQQVIPLLAQINAMFPPEARLEPFVLHTSVATSPRGLPD